MNFLRFLSFFVFSMKCFENRDKSIVEWMDKSYKIYFVVENSIKTSLKTRKDARNSYLDHWKTCSKSKETRIGFDPSMSRFANYCHVSQIIVTFRKFVSRFANLCHVSQICVTFRKFVSLFANLRFCDFAIFAKTVL